MKSRRKESKGFSKGNKLGDKKLILKSSIVVIIVVSCILLASLSFIPEEISEQEEEEEDIFTTTIKIEFEEDFYLDFLDLYDNSQWSSEFLIYRLMISGLIIDNENAEEDNIKGDYGDHFVMNFADQFLLSLFFDTNLTYILEYIRSGVPAFNGKTLTYKIVREKEIEEIGIHAFDLSIANDTVIEDYFDFGNSIFIELIPNQTNNIKVICIENERLNSTHFIPYLKLNVNEDIITEKMAWNNTINPSLW